MPRARVASTARCGIGALNAATVPYARTASSARIATNADRVFVLTNAPCHGVPIAQVRRSARICGFGTAADNAEEKLSALMVAGKKSALVAKEVKSVVMGGSGSRVFRAEARRFASTVDAANDASLAGVHDTYWKREAQFTIAPCDSSCPP